METKQRYPTDMTDSQWNLIKELLSAAKPGGRPRTLDFRMVMNAIFYLVVSGCQGRMLPREYPNWKSVYPYFQLWRNAGTWQRIHDTLRARERERQGRHKHPTAGCLESQSVKTTQMPGLRGYDAGKQVTGRKRPLLVDTLDLLLGVGVTAASVSDPAGARLLLPGLGGFCKNLRKIWGGWHVSRATAGLGGRTFPLPPASRHAGRRPKRVCRPPAALGGRAHVRVV